MRALSATALLLAAAAATGCGAGTTSEDTSDRFQGQERLVANTVENLQSAADDGENAEICRDLLSRAFAARMAEAAAGCPAAVDAALEDADSNELDVRSVRIAGDRATARMRLETGDRDRFVNMTLVRQGNGWRIDAIA
jgi:hypothetical protein